MLNVNTVAFLATEPRKLEGKFGEGSIGTVGFKNGYSNEKSYIDYISWGKPGKFLNNYCRKGSQLYLVGHLEQVAYTSSAGIEVNKLRFVITTIEVINTSFSRSEQDRISSETAKI